MAKQKYYVVWKGNKPGIYTSWDDCKKQIAGFKGAVYKSFKHEIEAKDAYETNPDIFFDKENKSTPYKLLPENEQPNLISISVDAACAGNPGVMEYQGVLTDTGTRLFHFKAEEGTNNIGEFLALVHGLSYLKKNNIKYPVYTDSRTAMSWIRAKKCKTKLPINAKNKRLFDIIKRAEIWLQNNTFTTEILKWDTKKWGEIPADFGRK